MAALDDYAPPLATWLIVAVTLDAAPAGMSVSRVVAEVAARSAGRCTRPATVRAVLARMVEDGCAVVTAHRVGHRFPSRLHTLTDQGQALLRAALADLDRALTWNPHGTTSRTRKEADRRRA
ncbi:MAG: hypothetical protein IT382_01850 [Deltaproteobacteria bacterium]|nr:hypothetical protein [Deltaproteobacteria bacterium]